MLTLIKNGEVYAPEYLGKKDILLAGGKVVKIQDNISLEASLEAEVIDASRKKIVPGFIDQHVHIIGGGGEAGFHSRTPELMLSKVIGAGVTTVVGLLGTDGNTRHVETLLAKAIGLEEEGISTYILTGSYAIPSTTLTGSVRRDIMFIDKVMGVKIAFSDHRSSRMTEQELTRLAADVRLAGMLSAKPGLIHMHMGDSPSRLDAVFNIMDKAEIPAKHFIPTHVTRNRDLFEQAKEFAKIGGRIDITAADIKPGINDDQIDPVKAIIECLDNGVSEENITMSSDGNGSMPVFDENRKLIGMGVGDLNTVFNCFRRLVKEENMPLEKALQFTTSNVAKVLEVYPQKGSIQENSDGDLLILDEDLNLDGVFAKGKKAMENGKILIKGTFE